MWMKWLLFPEIETYSYYICSSLCPLTAHFQRIRNQQMKVIYLTEKEKEKKRGKRTRGQETVLRRIYKNIRYHDRT